MGQGPGIRTIFIFLFFVAIIALKIGVMIRSDRVYEQLNRLERAIEQPGFADGVTRTATKSASRPRWSTCLHQCRRTLFPQR